MFNESNKNIRSTESCSFAKYHKRLISHFDKSINQNFYRVGIDLNG